MISLVGRNMSLLWKWPSQSTWHLFNNSFETEATVLVIRNSNPVTCFSAAFEMAHLLGYKKAPVSLRPFDCV